MSSDIVQHWNATTQPTTSDPFRKLNLSDGSPAIAGSVIVFGGLCDSTGAEIVPATQATLAALSAKVPALGQALAAASTPVVLTAAQLTTLTPPAAITGFATAAKQPALGTAGTASADVISVQGIASMTALKVDGSAVTQPISGSVTANIGTVGTLATAANQTTGNTSLAAIATSLAGTLTVAAHAVTNAGVFAVQVDGAALTSLQLLDDSIATVGSAIVSKGIAAVGTDGTNARIIKTDTNGELQIDVLTSGLPTGASTAANQTTANTALAAIQTSVQLIDDAVYTDGAAISKFLGLAAYDEGDTGTMKPLKMDNSNGALFVNITGSSGLVGVATPFVHDSGPYSTESFFMGGGYAKATAPSDVSGDGDGVFSWHLRNGSQVCNLAVGGTLVTGSAGLPVAQQGTWNITNAGTFAVQDDARTTGGETSYSFLSTAAVQAAQIKGSAGTVYSMQFFNLNAAARYVRLYNQTGAPASTDGANIVWRGMIPGNTAAAGFVVNFPKGKAFATGIGIRVSGAIADNDATSLGANEVVGNVGYK